MAATKKPTAKKQSMKTAKVAGQQRGQRQHIHAGAYVLDEAFNEEAHDLGPWVETPRSTRVSAFRYDYLNNALQIIWRNGGPAYIFLEVPYERYRSMARAASKGRFVNTGLGPPYRHMTPDELQAASNSQRQQLTSRVR
jgi:hypothetical protein